VVALALFEALAPSIAAIDTSTLTAPWEVQLVIVIKYFFRVTPTALLGGFAWSLFGYLKYKFQNGAVSYELDKFTSTLMWFEGIIMPTAVALPQEQALAVAGIIMAIKSVLNQFKTGAPQTTSATAKPG
jgi:hypothetical protein